MKLSRYMMTKLALLLFLSLNTYAVKLFPVPIEKQLKDSSAVIQGIFLGKTYKKMHDGKIVTEASFQVKRSAGISSRHMVNKNLFRIYFSGGVWQGLRYHNASAPSFINDREYVILLRKTSFGFIPTMDRLGVYELMNSRGILSISSMAFPQHHRLGRIEMETFDLGIKAVFNEYLHEFHSDKYVYRPKSYVGRVPSSVKKEEASIEESKISIIWVAFAFGMLGAMRMRRYRRKYSRG